MLAGAVGIEPTTFGFGETDALPIELYPMNRPYSMILATTPAPTVRPPSRMAKTFFHGDRRNQLHRDAHVVASMTISLVLGQLNAAGDVGRTEVELRTVVVEERRVTAAFVLAQHIHFSGEVGVRLDGAGLAQQLVAALGFFALGAAQQDADVVACLTLVQGLLNISTPVQVVLMVGLMPTISISSPTLTMPRSIRPVTTVPRPEMENTSSTGMRKAPSTGALRGGDVAVQGFGQFQDGLFAQDSPASPSRASLALP